MSQEQILLLVGLGIVFLLVLWLAVALFARAFAVAAFLFGWAAELGFLGVVVYFACWMFMFPVMVVVCLIGAILGWGALREELDVGPNSAVDVEEARQWREENGRFERAKRRRLAGNSVSAKVNNGRAP